MDIRYRLKNIVLSIYRKNNQKPLSESDYDVRSKDDGPKHGNNGKGGKIAAGGVF
jgi:hypothetical protein